MSDWSQGIVLSILWGVPFVILVAFGLRVTSATMTSAITPSLMPVFAAAFTWAFLGEACSGRQFIGFALIMVGLVVLSTGFWLEHARLDVSGLLALIGAAAMWALYSLKFKRSTLTAMQAAGLVCVWSAVFYVPIYLLSGVSRIGQAHFGELLFQACYQGFMMSVVANFAFNRAVSILGAAAATTVIALVPVAATMLAIPVLHEQPSRLSFIAVAAIACGVFWASRPARTPGTASNTTPAHEALEKP